jgi:class 3 adenylate cyclase
VGFVAVNERELAAVAEASGDLEEAERRLRRSLDRYGWASSMVGALHARLAEIAARRGRMSDAEAELEQARSCRALAQSPWGRAADLHRAEAVVAGSCGSLDAAAVAFTRALEIYRQWQLPLHAAATLHAWGRVLLGAGDRAGAVEKLNEALDVYQRCQVGAPWLEGVLADKLDAQGGAGASTSASIDVVAAGVLRDQPDLAPHASEDGTVTLLFTDVEGSTALNEELGDRRWLEILAHHHALVRDQVRAHGGDEVKSAGDGFMLAFASARRGVECAVAIQRAVAAEPGQTPLRVRIGVHTGEVVRSGDDFFGRHVNLAARIGAAAAGGEVLISAVTRELVAGTGDLAVADGRDVELKGFEAPQRVYAVNW